MLPLLCATALAAAPYLGVEWRPLSRGDLQWVEEGNSSGLAVGGLDGFVRPQLMAYGGAWFSEHVGAHLSVGTARRQTTSWVGDVWVQRHWGVFRPAFDVRVSLLPRTDPRPNPWVFLGAHLDLPSARDTSNGYTDEEALDARRTATLDRLRLGAIGGRVGIGADLALVRGLRLGLQTALDWQRSLFLTQDPSVSVSWVAAEAALLVELHWDTRSDAL
jgi:hypothetical protein